MRLLECPIRNYAWGSRTSLAELRGVPTPAPHPEAELWMGAHPADPAWVVSDGDRVSLIEAIGADPGATLGKRVASEHGEKLPFLLKVLAAEEPLSLQAHPSLQQAKEGFARENRAGIALGAAHRNYKDDNHKPELVVALTPFKALAGFRDPVRTAKLLTELAGPAMKPYCDMLAEQPDSAGLRALFTTWITLPQQPLRTLLDDLTDGCVRHLKGAKNGPFRREAQMLLELAEHYPGDAGVLTASLLNYAELAPGEGLYVTAGSLHAYLHGMGVEVMATSDNVLRGGMTPKHVDVAELLRVLDFSPSDALPVSVHNASPGGTAEYIYDTPAPEFRLSRIELDATGLHHSVSLGLIDPGPQILVCTRGGVTARCGSEEIDVPQGGALWVPAQDPEVILHAHTARTQVFRALVPAVG
ncbi:mannose-6-phosphate isomerase, class I [Hoyosella altamirensis]|nr:mannose-6-phosphate isomerase, class I [Hoyosella altamirensis]